MTSKYEDFNVRIWPDGSAKKRVRRHVAQANNSNGDCSDRENLRFLHGRELENLLLRLENAVLRAGNFRSGACAGEVVLRKFGSEMFRMIFRESPSIASLFNVSLASAKNKGLDGLRIRLIIEESPEISGLPWEYMYSGTDEDGSGTDYLCLSPQSPLVRFPKTSEPPQVFPVDGSLKILAMSANPGGRGRVVDGLQALETRKEEKEISDAMKSLRHQVKFVAGETHKDLMNWIQRERWNVFHFIGHGGIDERRGPDGVTRKEGFVVLSDGRGGAERVLAEDLALTLRLCSSLRLVVLNCCDSAQGTGAANPAAALARSVPSVIAMQYPIPDDVAITFSTSFYGSLASGQSLEMALTAARVAMWKRSRVHWGIPILITRAPSDSMCGVDVDASTSNANAGDEDADSSSAFERTQQFAQAELRRVFE